MDCKEYRLNILEIYGTYNVADKKSRVEILYKNSIFSVEEYVKKLFEDKGYVVIAGADLHLFLWFCCGNFPIFEYSNSFGRLNKFIELNNQNRAICISGSISDNFNLMVANASQMWNCYYYKDSHISGKSNILAESVKAFNDKERINLMRIYSEAPYDPRGAPDLFAFNRLSGDKQFIEVKSFRDSLRYEQLLLASKITSMIGNLFTLAYVLPQNYEELSNNSIKTSVLNIEAGYLIKLIKLTIDKVFDGYQQTNIEIYATRELGVSPNSLCFFLNKMKGLNINYDLKALDKYSITLSEYLLRMESEWEKLTKKNRQVTLL